MSKPSYAELITFPLWTLEEGSQLVHGEYLESPCFSTPVKYPSGWGSNASERNSEYSMRAVPLYKNTLERAKRAVEAGELKETAKGKVKPDVFVKWAQSVGIPNIPTELLSIQPRVPEKEEVESGLLDKQSASKEVVRNPEEGRSDKQNASSCNIPNVTKEKPNHAYWCELSSWPLEVAVYLAYDRKPLEGAFSKCSSEPANDIEKLFKFAQEAIETKVLKIDNNKVIPYDFMEWAKQKGVMIPKEFENLTKPKKRERTSKESSIDKKVCQAIALVLWDQDPNKSASAIARGKMIEKYGNGWNYEQKTITEWLREVSPKKNKIKKNS